MQPYPNPNYFQYMQPPQINPYMQRVEQLQQYQQAIQPQNQFSTLGKMVESIEMVKATDIPMDGNMYYFPKADGSELYSKQWLANGQTRILTFKPVLDDEPNNSATEYEKSNLDALDGLKTALYEQMELVNERLDKIEKNIRVSKGKKEVADE